MNHLGHESLYRGGTLVDKLKDYTIVVCGCGAIGSNLIVNMIRQGFENITVIDYDRIDDHNRGTQIWGKREVGSKKVAVMKNIAFSSMGVQINAIDKKLTESTIRSINWPNLENMIVIDSFDNSDSRKLVTNLCKDDDFDCLHIGLAEGYGEVVWNEVYDVPKDNVGADVCEYPLSRNICMMSVIIGIETIIKYISTGEKISRSITLGDFKILELE
jgi:molybdopterin/thiamine biosynthesis adenylyltransferase